MALADFPYSFNPALIVDAAAEPLANVTVTLLATPGGDPLQISDGQGNDIGTTLTSTDSGVLPFHRTTVTQPFVDAGSVIVLQESANELAVALPQALAAQAAAEGAQGAAEASQVAAESAAATVEGVVIDASDTAVAGAINSAGSGSRAAVDARVAVAVAPIAPTGDVRAVGIGALIANARDFGAVGDGTTDDTAAIQAAIDSLAGVVFFPGGPNGAIANYSITGLTITGKTSLLGADPRKSRLVMKATASPTTDAVRVAITSNQGSLDVRNWSIRGLTVTAAAGGRHAIYLAPKASTFPLLSSRIDNNNLTGNPANGGYDLYADGNLAHSEISLNTCTTGVWLNLLDGNTIRKNLIFGTRPAIVLDMIYGVHNNTVEDNTLVSQGGAVHIINGDAIRIRNNQMEQSLSYGENNSTPSATVYVEGASRVCYNLVVENNNFGGGTNVDYGLYLANAQRAVVTKNHFVAHDLAEVYATASAKYNVLAPDNYVRGTVSRPRPRTIFKMETVDLGVGNMGFLHPASELAHQNGWAGGDFFKDATGTVHFVTNFTGGTTATGTVIGTLPVGFRPAVNTRTLCATTGAVSTLLITSGAGAISASGALGSNVVTPSSFLSGKTNDV